MTVIKAQAGILEAMRSILPSDSPIHAPRYNDLGAAQMFSKSTRTFVEVPAVGHFSILSFPALARLLS